MTHKCKIKECRTCDMEMLESEDQKHLINVDGLNEVLGSYYPECWWSFKDISKGCINYDNIILNQDKRTFVSGELPDVKLPAKADVKKKLIEKRKQNVFDYFADYEWNQKQLKDKEDFIKANKDKITEQCESFYKEIEDKTRI